MPAKQTLLNLQTSSLRYAEFSQFIARFLDDVEKENLDVKKEEILSNLLGQLKTNLPAYQASLGQVRVSEKSSTITEAGMKISKRYAKQLNPIAIVAAKTKRQLIRL